MPRTAREGPVCLPCDRAASAPRLVRPLIGYATCQVCGALTGWTWGPVNPWRTKLRKLYGGPDGTGRWVRSEKPEKSED